MVLKCLEDIDSVEVDPRPLTRDYQLARSSGGVSTSAASGPGAAAQPLFASPGIGARRRKCSHASNASNLGSSDKNVMKHLHPKSQERKSARGILCRRIKLPKEDRTPSPQKTKRRSELCRQSMSLLNVSLSALTNKGSMRRGEHNSVAAFVRKRKSSLIQDMNLSIITPRDTRSPKKGDQVNSEPYQCQGAISEKTKQRLHRNKHRVAVRKPLISTRVSCPLPLAQVKPGLLPPQAAEDAGRLTVVLDMDETLIHSEFDSNNNFRQSEDRMSAAREPDFHLKISAEEGDPPENVYVYKRPGLERFLEAVNRDFELVIFTAALPVYAKPVIDAIDPKGLCKYRLYRSATRTFRGQPFVKDMGVMGREMGRIVLVDNNPCAMLAKPDNAIPILSFYDSPEDKELDKMLELLYTLKDTADVRPVLRSRFNFRENVKHIMDLTS